MSRLFLLFSLLFALTSCNTPSPTVTTSPVLVHSGTTVVASGATSAVTKEIDPPVIGSGSHSIVIYTDYQCPACINFHKTLEPILVEYAMSGKTTITYKQFPLTTIHQNAYRDALAAMCAAGAGQYVGFKDAIYALESEKGGRDVSDADRVDVAKSVGLDTSEFSACLSGQYYQSRVDQDMRDGDVAGVPGTPTIFLDEKKLDMGVFNSIESFRAFMDRYLAE